MGYLCCEGGADGVDVEFFGAVVDRHVAAEAVVLCVGEELVHEVGELEASLQVDAGFAVLAEGYIAGVEGAGGTDGYAFFAGGDLAVSEGGCKGGLMMKYHVETQPALPLCFKHEEVHYAHCSPLAACPCTEGMALTLDHILVYLQCLFILSFYTNLLIYYLSILIHDAVRCDSIQL